MKNYITYIGILVLLVSFISCKKDKKFVDKEGPQVEVTVPTENFIFYPGDEIKMSCVISDDSELKSVEVTLINIDEDASTESKNIKLKSVPKVWEPVAFIENLTGKEKTYTLQVLFEPVPHYMVFGNYELSYKCVDELNNESITKVPVIFKEQKQ